MKTKQFLLTCLVVFTLTPNFAQWVKQTLPNTANPILYPQPVGQQTMWMTTFHYFQDTTGKPYELIHTKDGGKTYTKSVLIPDGRNYFLGLDPIDSVRASLLIVDFINNVYTIQRTSNAGQTWQELPYKPHTYPDLLHFYDANNGIYMGDPDSLGMVIQYTTDGGNTFTRIPNTNLPATLPNEIAFSDGYKIEGDAITIFAVGGINFEKWRVWRSLDRGRTWTANPNGINNSDFQAAGISFSDKLHGIAMPNVFSEFDYTLFTEDGGITWNKSNKLPGEKTFPIANLPGTQTFMALFGDVKREKLFSALTNDFGKTWNTFTDVAPYTLDSTFGLPINFANLEIIDNHTAWSRFSRLELFRYDSPIPLVPKLPDLDLQLTADNDGLPLYGSVKYTLTLTNRGISPATGVKINWLPPYKRTNNGVGSYAYQAAYADKGRYDSWNGVWTLDRLNVGAIATATFHLFVLDNTNDVTQTAQVIACNEKDLDSAPSNMSGTPKEDDEIGYVAKSLIPHFIMPDLIKLPSELSVSPNPAIDIINLTINPVNDAYWSIRVLNSLGQTVFTQNGQYSFTVDIDAKSFENGLYLVEYQSQGERKVEKMLVQH